MIAKKFRADSKSLTASVRLLGHPGHGVTEVRALSMRSSGGPVLVGYFNDFRRLVAEVERVGGHEHNVYLGVQPRPKELLERSANKLGRAKGGKTSDIQFVTALALDLDPDRPADSASTKSELELAVKRADLVCSWFEKQGWQRPVRAMSGNGVQLWCGLPPITLTRENRVGVQAKLKAFEASIRKRFAGDGVSIDSTHDLARITKLIGTLSVKGTNTAERPYRLTRFLDAPERREDAVLRDHILSLPVTKRERQRPAKRKAGRSERSTPWGRKRLEERLRDIRSAQPGGRNVWLNKSAFAVAQGVASGEIDEEEARGALTEVAAEVGLSEGEARKTIESGWRSGLENPVNPKESQSQRARNTNRDNRVTGSQRPSFVIKKGEGHKAVAFGIEQLVRDERVFQRGQELVAVANWSEAQKKKEKLFERAVGAPVIATLIRPQIWTILSEIVRWQRWDGRTQTEVNCDPSAQVVAGVEGAGEWPGARPLVGLTPTPILREDGSVHSARGYDSETGLFYVPSGKLPAIPKSPSQADARGALEALLEVVCDFPFTGGQDRSGWLAALFTAIVRPLCPCVPMFVFDANTPGSGKSLLADVIGAIATGRAMARGAHVESDDELRKRIFTHALAGDSLVLIDNAPNGWTVGWPSLDLCLTATEIVDRVLGESRRVSLPNTMSWYMTGNNLAIKGDTARRTIRIRLESPLEHPENRPASSFKHPDLREWVSKERPRLLGAALTVLSAYLQAGKPQKGLDTLGAFEEWSRIVCGALVWLEQENPILLLANKDPDADPRAGAHIQFLEALLRYPDGLTAAEMLKETVREDDPDTELRDAIAELCPGRGPATTRKLGFALRELRGRVRTFESSDSRISARLVNNVSTKSKKSAKWRVEVIGTAGGYGGIRGISPALKGRTVRIGIDNAQRNDSLHKSSEKHTPYAPNTPPGSEPGEEWIASPEEEVEEEI